MFHRRAAHPPSARILVAPAVLLAFASGLASADAQSENPSAIEVAIADSRCAPRRLLPDSEEYHQCIDTELASLRADFGRDLGRLSRNDRRHIDQACSRISPSLEREAYLECIQSQLAAVRSRYAPSAPPSAPPAGDIASPAAVPAPDTPQPGRPPRSFPVIPIGVALVAIAGAAGGAVLVRRRRRPPASPHPCRTCGRDVSAGGDLCPECRFAAAEALRRAASDRAEHERLQEVERRHYAERKQEELEARERAEEEARLAAVERERQEAETTRELEAQRLEEEARLRRAIGVEGDEDLDRDPLTVLGLASDVSPEVIRAAYEEALAKYDPEQVAGMGFEVQRHFASKRKAIERAWEALSAPTPPASEGHVA